MVINENIPGQRSFEVPVLFLVFNRPDLTSKVFESIRAVAPKQLFIAADGPRDAMEGEKIQCEQVRKIVSNVDWDCDLKTLFREENLGCGLAVSSAISWFFENVEEGIILEDDTLPSLSFFTYCSILLERYRDQKNIMIISGNNFQNGIQRGKGSYYFSKYIHIWGWATWKRTWELYDFNIRQWQNIEFDNNRNLFVNPEEDSYWKTIFKKIYLQQIDTWDYQLLFSSILNNGINVMPNKNLVTNIGFKENSTHTKDPHHPLAGLIKYEYTNDIVPDIIGADEEADLFTFNNVYNEKSLPANKNRYSYFLLKDYCLRAFKKIIRLKNN